MSGKTGIQWTDRTWNPVVGCTKVSQGCKLCYAKTLHDMRHAACNAGKLMARQYARPFETVQLMPDRLAWPLSLRQPSRIFVNSVSDLFHEDVPFDYIDDVFAVMALAPRHTFQVLTKRPERMLEYMSVVGIAGAVAAAADGHGWVINPDVLAARWPLPNVWLGVSVENQEAADERIPLLLQTPASVRFLSCEPLLGPIDLSNVNRYGDGDSYDALCGWRATYGYKARNKDECSIAVTHRRCPPVDWVIVGGESGTSKQNPRPMRDAWARTLRDQCVAAGVPFLFKQWGDWLPESQRRDQAGWERLMASGPHHMFDDGVSVRVGKKRAGRELDGRTWDEFPAAAP